MHSMRQLQVLLWKNYIQAKRHYIWTAAQIILPLLINCLCIFLFAKFSGDLTNSSSLLTVHESVDAMTKLKPWHGLEMRSWDTANKYLEYTIHVYHEMPTASSTWDNHFTANVWMSSYRPVAELQASIDSTFLVNSGAVSNMSKEEYALKSLPGRVALPPPEGAFEVALISIYPFLLMIVMLFLVLVTTREIVNERPTIQPYLSTLGMSANMFFLSHALFALCKYVIAFAIPLFIIALISKILPTGLFMLLVVLYGLAAITFATLLGVIFSSGSVVLMGVLLAWLVLVGLVAMAPNLEYVILNFAYSFNFNVAMNNFMRAIVLRFHMGLETTAGNMFSNGGSHFTYGFSLVMLTVDIILMIILIWIITHFDQIRHELCGRLFSKHKTSQEGDSATRSRKERFLGWVQADPARDSQPGGIEIEHLVKIYPTGEKALRGLNLKALKGEVTVLLGHNGAGKSTAFGCLTGLVTPTEGNVRIASHDLRWSPKKCRANVGLCPQYNPLLDDLTVKEHLRLAHGLKGARTSVEEETHYLLAQLKMEGKAKDLSCNLSGGMKRKLCVAMALIGGSKVILLDEPTAGMDPAARLDVQRLLENEKKNDRTILLTTHYMDEAERLGDWVFVMHSGKAVAAGTCAFLKRKFGSGYTLVIVAENTDDNTRDFFLRICKQHVKGATMGKQHGKQIEIVLPEDERDTGFIPLFEVLECIQDKRVDNLKLSTEAQSMMNAVQKVSVTTFGLSLNTLEQVFLKIGELYDMREKLIKQGKPLDAVIDEAGQKDFAMFMGDQHQVADRRGAALVLGQMAANIRKRALFIWNNVLPFLLLVAEMFGIALFLAYIDNMAGVEQVDITPGMFSHGFVGVEPRFFQSGASSPTVHQDALNAQIKHYGLDVRRPGEGVKVEQFYLDLPVVLPEMIYGLGYESNKDVLYFNRGAPYSMGLIVNLYSNSFLSGWNPEAKKNAVVTRLKINSPRITDITDELPGAILMLAVSTLVTYFVTFPIVERHSRFRHQQLLTGMSPIVLWSMNALVDLIIYIFLLSILFVFIATFQMYTKFYELLILVWMVFFSAALPFVYAVSFMFSSHSKAMLLLTLYMVFVPVAIKAGLLLVPLLNLGETEVYERIFGFMVPAYSFMFTSIVHETRVDSWIGIRIHLLEMGVFGVVASVVFLLIQMRFIRYQFFKATTCCNEREPIENPRGDETVFAEEERVKDGPPPDSVLYIYKLTKVFGKMRALNSLSMSVERKECFGLLGVNGAGKTTTFDVLTGRTFSSSGVAQINGVDVSHRTCIGYCPQFEALIQELTCRQTLEIIAQMHGYSNYKEKANIILDSVGMLDMGKKKVKHCSGGQRRRVSLGVALLSPSDVIVLDEPTAGVDPKSRREIWELLLKVREQSALLLTSHSMDECEALCSRIAILKSGNMITIGTSQDIKSKHGNSYTLSMTATDPDHRDTILQSVSEMYPLSVCKDADTLSLSWELPRKPTDKWSTMFAEAQKLASQMSVKHYCLCQLTLEDAFISLVSDDVKEPETVQEKHTNS